MCKPERARVPVRALAGLAALAAAAAVVLGAVWLVTATPFLAVAVTVLAVLCVAGVAVIVREVTRTRGTMWRPARPRPAKRVRPVRRPALPVGEPLAIEAPKPVLTAVVLESRETVR